MPLRSYGQDRNYPYDLCQQQFWQIIFVGGVLYCNENLNKLLNVHQSYTPLKEISIYQNMLFVLLALSYKGIVETPFERV
jgi:hypothetical protein